MKYEPVYKVNDETKIVSVCAWCDKDKRITQEWDKDGYKVSHGACPQHEKELLGESDPVKSYLIRAGLSLMEDYVPPSNYERGPFIINDFRFEKDNHIILTSYSFIYNKAYPQRPKYSYGTSIAGTYLTQCCSSIRIEERLSISGTRKVKTTTCWGYEGNDKEFVLDNIVIPYRMVEEKLSVFNTIETGMKYYDLLKKVMSPGELAQCANNWAAWIGALKVPLITEKMMLRVKEMRDKATQVGFNREDLLGVCAYWVSRSINVGGSSGWPNSIDDFERVKPATAEFWQRQLFAGYNLTKKIDQPPTEESIAHAQALMEKVGLIVRRDISHEVVDEAIKDEFCVGDDVRVNQAVHYAGATLTPQNHLEIVEKESREAVVHLVGDPHPFRYRIAYEKLIPLKRDTTHQVVDENTKGRPHRRIEGKPWIALKGDRVLYKGRKATLDQNVPWALPTVNIKFDDDGSISYVWYDECDPLEDRIGDHELVDEGIDSSRIFNSKKFNVGDEVVCHMGNSVMGKLSKGKLYTISKITDDGSLHIEADDNGRGAGGFDPGRFIPKNKPRQEIHDVVDEARKFLEENSTQWDQFTLQDFIACSNTVDRQYYLVEPTYDPKKSVADQVYVYFEDLGGGKELESGSIAVNTGDREIAGADAITFHNSRIPFTARNIQRLNAAGLAWLGDYFAASYDKKSYPDWESEVYQMLKDHGFQLAVADMGSQWAKFVFPQRDNTHIVVDEGKNTDNFKVGDEVIWNIKPDQGRCGMTFGKKNTVLHVYSNAIDVKDDEGKEVSWLSWRFDPVIERIDTHQVVDESVSIPFEKVEPVLSKITWASKDFVGERAYALRTYVLSISESEKCAYCCLMFKLDTNKDDTFYISNESFRNDTNPEMLNELTTSACGDTLYQTSFYNLSIREFLEQCVKILTRFDYVPCLKDPKTGVLKEYPFPRESTHAVVDEALLTESAKGLSVGMEVAIRNYEAGPLWTLARIKEAKLWMGRPAWLMESGEVRENIMSEVRTKQEVLANLYKELPSEEELKLIKPKAWLDIREHAKTKIPNGYELNMGYIKEGDMAWHTSGGVKGPGWYPYDEKIGQPYWDFYCIVSPSRHGTHVVVDEARKFIEEATL